MNRPVVSAPLLILLTALFIALIDNQTFWGALAQRLDLGSIKGLGFALTFLALMTGLMTVLLLVGGVKYLLKPLLLLFLWVSAFVAYFNSIGVVIDDEMLRNALETVTDHNTNEATELLSPTMLKHLFIYALLPSLAVLWVRVDYRSLPREALRRLTWAGGIVVVIIALSLMNFKYLTYFSRENRDLRLTLNPMFPISSAVKLYKRHKIANDHSFTILGEDAHQRPHPRKRVGIMVVGETARSDRFSLNGYELKTNPLLEKDNVINFPNAWSCGTSTAYSVPCMFSFRNRNSYSPGAAAHESNVLDVLKKSGVYVLWRDNNSSCKGVCERVASENLHHDFDPASPFYHEGEYTDEILLQDLDSVIDKAPGDVLIVMHTMGSHGPAYYRRYPSEFKRFQPACTSNAPQDCGDDSVNNAYINTIVYTDYILDRALTFLQSLGKEVDGFLLYASDHGESLGENGIYLHGLPYMIAPDAQKHVPMLAWLSPQLEEHLGVTAGKLPSCTQKEVSHDNLSHTLLGLYGVQTRLYNEKLDLFRGVCG